VAINLCNINATTDENTVLSDYQILTCYDWAISHVLSL